MYVLISHCLDVCGLHEMTVSLEINFGFSFFEKIVIDSDLKMLTLFQDLIKFDGPIFHRQMEKFEKATDEEMQRFVSSTKPIWVF